MVAEERAFSLLGRLAITGWGVLLGQEWVCDPPVFFAVAPQLWASGCPGPLGKAAHTPIDIKVVATLPATSFRFICIQTGEVIVFIVEF
jgi:hypothetical protein